MYRRHKPAFIILEIAGLIILLSALTPLFSDAYCSFLAGWADLVTPSDLIIQAQDSVFLISLKDWPAAMSLYSLPFLGGLILILSLLLVTPGIDWKKRPLYLVTGIMCSITLQVISLVVIGLLAYFNVDRWAGRSIAALFISVGIDLFPVIVWAAISYRYWWPVFSRPDTYNSAADAGKG